MARKAEGTTASPTSTTNARSAAQLKQLRSQIDKLDVEIVKLINQRAGIAAEIGRAKLEQGEDIFSPAREEEVYQNVLQINEKNKGPLPEVTVRAVFRGERRIAMRKPMEGDEETGRPTRTRKRSREAMAVSASDRPLFEALRSWRSHEAKGQHVPPYVIFNDRTLTEIAAVKPGSRAALAQVNGVGEGKLARYGEAVLDVVRTFEG